jgi:hypothetical protein
MKDERQCPCLCHDMGGGPEHPSQPCVCKQIAGEKEEDALYRLQQLSRGVLHSNRTLSAFHFRPPKPDAEEARPVPGTLLTCQRCEYDSRSGDVSRSNGRTLCSACWVEEAARYRADLALLMETIQPMLKRANRLVLHNYSCATQPRTAPPRPFDTEPQEIPPGPCDCGWKKESEELNAAMDAAREALADE